MRDLKDMVRYHSYQMSELLQLTPFDFQIIKLMIAQDIQEEIDRQQQ